MENNQHELVTIISEGLSLPLPEFSAKLKEEGTVTFPRAKLYSIIRGHNLITRKSPLKATQFAIEKGLMYNVSSIKEINGRYSQVVTVMVTPEGMDYIIKRL